MINERKIISETGFAAVIEETDASGEKYQYRAMKCDKCKSWRGSVNLQYSLGIVAGYYHDGKCWDNSGYRKEGREGYSFYDVGEYYDESDY